MDFFYVILFFLICALVGAFSLSMRDFRKKNVCPKIIGIPACYLILLIFIIATFTHISDIPSRTLFFNSAIGTTTIIALIGTIIEISGTKICPRSSNDIPLCYFSLGLGIGLLILKNL